LCVVVIKSLLRCITESTGASEWTTTQSGHSSSWRCYDNALAPVLSQPNGLINID